MRRMMVFSATVLMALGVLSVPLTNAGASSSAKAKAPGTVDVLYAGSFLDLMEQQVDPAFHKATGYTVSGYSAGSTALASEIAGGTQVGDVFISASPSVNASLEGSANGNWVSSYKEFGFSPLVLGYNPKSKFAKALETKPWYQVVDRSGFLLGRTDPATDPKGVLAVDALTGVALSYSEPNLAPLASSTSNVFEETALVGDLQAGQLDAGFFYAVEAAAAHLKTVPLVGTHLSGQYTVAILNRAPHEAAAKAFVKFLLSAAGQKILKGNGVTPIVPALTFHASTTTTTTTSSTTSTTSP
ncbi:MAG: extracellular solute-binding protein [Acidimicrobiales bacterium]|jgi:molybdate/tungstate transport system substrate-binding protein